MDDQKLSKKLGENIRSRRDKVGYSQKELAREIGKTETTISQIELGNANPTFNTLASIAKALGVSLKKLIP